MVTTWYKPEFTRERRICFCGAKSIGRTRYFNGTQYTYRYQCSDHLPAAARVSERVS